MLIGVIPYEGALFDGFGRLLKPFPCPPGYRAEIEVGIRFGDLPERRN